MSNGKELQVIVKAKELAEHTIRVTSNNKVFPKKFRFSIVNEMQCKSLYIHNKLLEANRTLLKNKDKRSELQTDAITYCEELQFYIELSVRLEIISYERAEYWSGLVSDIKRMTIAWRQRDKER